MRSDDYKKAAIQIQSLLVPLEKINVYDFICEKLNIVSKKQTVSQKKENIAKSLHYSTNNVFNSKFYTLTFNEHEYCFREYNLSAFAMKIINNEKDIFDLKILCSGLNDFMSVRDINKVLSHQFLFNGTIVSDFKHIQSITQNAEKIGNVLDLHKYLKPLFFCKNIQDF